MTAVQRTLTGIALSVIVVALLAGCSSPTYIAGQQGGGGNGAIPLGTVRQLKPGDTWTYAVSGTGVAAGGGVVNLNPAVGTFTYSDTTIELNGQPGLHTVHATWPVTFSDVDYVEDWTFAVNQLGDGSLRLYGISMSAGFAVQPITSGDGYMQAPPFDQVPQLGTLHRTATAGPWGDLDWTITHEATVDVRIGGTTYACYRWDVAGFGVPITVWFSPQIGVVKVTASYPDQHGTTNTTLELQGTSFEVQDS